MKRIGQITLVAAAVIFFIVLFYPTFASNLNGALLNSVGNSKAYGSAQLIPNLQGQGSGLQVNIQGLLPHVQYVVTLEQGRCGGNVVADVGNVTANEKGDVATIASLKNIDSTLQQNIWVDVRQSATGPSVACGKVQVNNFVTSLSSSNITASSAAASPTSTTKSDPATNTPANANNSANQNFFPSLSGDSVAGFPQTGVAPAKSNSYDNYKFPRKY